MTTARAAVRRGIARVVVAPGTIVLLLALFSLPAAAQSACVSLPSTAVRAVARRWPAPLDRQVTLQGDNVTLRDGLARLAMAAHVRLSYVAELLPLDRPTCLSYRAAAAGDVLADLLRGTELEPVVAGDDQVVLAPARRTAKTPPADEAQASRASVLDRVVVTGSAGPLPERSEATSMAVISGERLARQETGSLSSLINASVPGIWMWQQAPTTLIARYGSVRGASSFGVSFPKIYIDGIEVANPLLVRQVDPATIERLEVIRGPQGGALYGADANSGVINITTRHDGVENGGHRLQLESTAGMSASRFARADVMTQQHALSFRAGASGRSAGLALSMGTLGAYVPGAFARSSSATGDVRRVGERTVFTGSARLFSERAGTLSNPLLPELGEIPSGGGFPRTHESHDDNLPYARAGMASPHMAPDMTSFGPPVGVDTTATQSVREYTVGGTLAYAPNDRWTHTFVLGIDGYRLVNPAVEQGPIPSATDSALAAVRGGSDRVTARASSSAHFDWTDRSSTDVTFTAEHAAAREESAIGVSMLGQSVGGPGQPGSLTYNAARLVG